MQERDSWGSLVGGKRGAQTGHVWSQKVQFMCFFPAVTGWHLRVIVLRGPRRSDPVIKRENPMSAQVAWRTFQIFFIFFRLGEGEGGVRGRREGGVAEFLLKIPEGGGVSRRRGRGAGRCLQRIWDFFFGGGGAKYFFFVAEMSTKVSKPQL